MSCVMITNISTGHRSCPMSCIQSSVSFCTVGRARSNLTLVYTSRELTVSLEEGSIGSGIAPNPRGQARSQAREG